MVQSSPQAALDVYKITSGMAEGDEEAYALFYQTYCDRLFRYLLVMSRGEEELSRDLLQNTMIKIVRYIKPFEKEEILWSWLTQVARTSFIDALRKQHRQPQVVVLTDQDWAAPDVSTVSLPLFLALEKGMEELPPDEQRLLQAVYFEEASHKELAYSEQTTPKAIESRLSRIRQKLRQRILRFLKHEERI